MSGLNEYLCWLLSGSFIRRLLPCLYCDGIFAIHPTILPCYVNPTPEQEYLNLKFASKRQYIEHVFGDHRVRFRLFSLPHCFHLFDSAVKIRRRVPFDVAKEDAAFILKDYRGFNTQGKRLHKNLYQAYEVQVFLRIVDSWYSHVKNDMHA
jgi:hypothetical protein